MAATRRSDDGRDDDTVALDLDAGTAVVDAVRTTLGPNGMDKMVVERDGSVLVTNTGSSVLDRLEIEHPIGRLVAAAGESQDLAVSDGSTTAVILVGELLEHARDLFDDGVHPRTVVEGYGRATEYACDRLDEYAIPVDETDTDMLERIVATTVTGRWDGTEADRFADLTVSALRAANFNIGRLTLHDYPGGELRDSTVLDGILVDMEVSPTTIEGIDSGLQHVIRSPRIALVRGEIALEDATGPTSITVEDATDLDAVREYESETARALVENVRRTGADVLVCQRAIDDELRTALARAGVLTVERARQDEFDAITRATGARAALSAADLTTDDLGRAEAAHHREIGQASTLLVEDCPEESHASVVLRGGTPHVVEEMRRIVGDAVDAVVHALRDGTVVPGGGATAMALSRDLTARAAEIDGRQQLVVEAYADALSAIPRTLATNAGRDPIDALASLRARQATDGPRIGIDETGAIRNTVAEGVLDPTAVIRACLLNAREMATTILRIDDVLPARESDDEGDADAHSHGSGTSSGDAHGGYPWAIGH